VSLHRIRQGLNNLTAAMGPEEWALVARWLSPAERSLFQRMQRADQLHCVRVTAWLLAEGESDEIVLRAALLHDVGKTRCHLTVIHRTLYVLLAPLFRSFPPLFMGSSGDSHWWMPYYVIANHPRIGASMLARAGCEERLWRLVELHQQDPQLVANVPEVQWTRQALVKLRRADSHN